MKIVSRRGKKLLPKKAEWPFPTGIPRGPDISIPPPDEFLDEDCLSGQDEEVLDRTTRDVDIDINHVDFEFEIHGDDGDFNEDDWISVDD